MEGKPVVALAAIFQHTPDAIVTLADKKTLTTFSFHKENHARRNDDPAWHLQAVF